MILYENKNNVSILKLNRNIINAINLELVHQFTGKMQELKSGGDTHAVVLTSSNNKFFSIGFDIPELLEYSMEEMKVFYTSFNKLCLDLFTFPKPVFAGLTGHAIAGGCILALCCDYRYIAEGRKLMGLNEIKLGVPVPYPGDCILKQTVAPKFAREILDFGEFYQSHELLEIGMVDRMLARDQVVPTAVERARQLGEMHGKAFRIIKQNRVEKIQSLVQQNQSAKEDEFLACWFSQEARERLTEAKEKF